MGVSRRGAAGAIMARIKEGLGSEALSPQAAKRPMAAAAPRAHTHTYEVRTQGKDKVGTGMCVIDRSMYG